MLPWQRQQAIVKHKPNREQSTLALHTHMATTSTTVTTMMATVNMTMSTVTKATTTVGSAMLTPSASTPPNCAHQMLTRQHPTGHQHWQLQTEWSLLIPIMADIRQWKCCPFTYPLHGTNASPLSCYHWLKTIFLSPRQARQHNMLCGRQDSTLPDDNIRRPVNKMTQWMHCLVSHIPPHHTAHWQATSHRQPLPIELSMAWSVHLPCTQLWLLTSPFVGQGCERWAD